ncbi:MULTISPECIES: hypothetical protein [unclassified Streptococcus]|uniref:hypothetical protein n=1 Tax=unclassified Streptococcus TaxID=2608887 RepID=UPI0014301CD4|nr:MULTISPECIES: hypothetical protein [unclassified Streptococcus]MBF0806677.1 hypothetical protein [Streptococcus sp. 19428wA2_WM07]
MNKQSSPKYCFKEIPQTELCKINGGSSLYSFLEKIMTVDYRKTFFPNPKK